MLMKCHILSVYCLTLTLFILNLDFKRAEQAAFLTKDKTHRSDKAFFFTYHAQFS